MSTASAISTIQQGSRVVYSVGSKEYNAISAGTPSVGYNQGLKLFSAYLNLAYMNEAGELVKISAAPLLSVAVDDIFLDEAALAAAKKDASWFDGGVDNDELIASYKQRLIDNPRTIGWRPGNVDDAPTNDPMLKSSGIDGDAGDWTQTEGAGLTDNTSLGYRLSIPAAGDELERSYEETQPELEEASAASKLEAMAADGNELAQVTAEAHVENSEVLPLQTDEEAAAPVDPADEVMEDDTVVEADSADQAANHNDSAEHTA